MSKNVCCGCAFSAVSVTLNFGVFIYLVFWKGVSGWWLAFPFFMPYWKCGEHGRKATDEA